MLFVLKLEKKDERNLSTVIIFDNLVSTNFVEIAIGEILFQTKNWRIDKTVRKLVLSQFYQAGISIQIIPRLFGVHLLS